MNPIEVIEAHNHLGRHHHHHYHQTKGKIKIIAIQQEVDHHFIKIIFQQE